MIFSSPAIASNCSNDADYYSAQCYDRAEYFRKKSGKAGKKEKSNNANLTKNSSSPEKLRKISSQNNDRIDISQKRKPGEIVTSSFSRLPLLTDDKGMTLYYFDNDKEGISNCYSDCSVSWPPYLVSEGQQATENFSIVIRKDDSRQWAYLGRPLYYWVADQAAGDIKGNGIAGVWHILRSKDFKDVKFASMKKKENAEDIK